MWGRYRGLCGGDVVGDVGGCVGDVWMMCRAGLLHVRALFIVTYTGLGGSRCPMF